jgi:hypothetical protein
MRLCFGNFSILFEIAILIATTKKKERDDRISEHQNIKI